MNERSDDETDKKESYPNWARFYNTLIILKI